MATKYSVVVAGSSHNSLAAARALLKNGNFTIYAILTPAPKPIGRHQTLTPNPLHQFALDSNLPLWLITSQLKNLHDFILATPSPDFLLVVDFGYIIPTWLLNFPLIAPLNLHPSALPKYRGASPGQFVLLSGESTSALTLMKLNRFLDQGDIIFQQFFPVNETWTAADYYQFAFNETHLSSTTQALLDFAHGKITPQAQPLTSPTLIARELTKNDGFIPLEAILAALDPHQPWQYIFPSYDEKSNATNKIVDVLRDKEINRVILSPQQIHRSIHAFFPFPVVWTLMPTLDGPKRVKLLDSRLSPAQKLLLTRVQLEGKPPKDLTN